MASAVRIKGLPATAGLSVSIDRLAARVNRRRSCRDFPQEHRMTEAREWAGCVGGTWAAEWQRTDRSFGDLAPHLDAAIRAALPAGASRALDIGCGAGATALALAAAFPSLHITGVDLSPELLTVARDRASRGALPNVTFTLGDARRVAADHAPLDLLVSRHGVMFFDDPVAAFAALHAAATPGAPLVFTCFRAASENRWAADLALAITGAPPQPAEGPGPFAFANADRVGAIMAAAGWQQAAARPVDYAYRAGAGADPVGDAISFFSRIGPAAGLLRALAPAAREAALARIAALCLRHRGDDAVDFPAAAWLWTARA
jgi:SAM-dependent methyltransferase